MYQGLLLLLMNAGVLTGFAIVQQHVAKRRLSILPFYAMYSLLGCVLSLPRCWWGGGESLVFSNHFLLLAGITVLASLTTAVAVITCVTAMQSGHAGMVFTIVQSAMALSFLAAVIFWHEPLNVFRTGGLILVIVMFILLAPKDKGEQVKGGMGWFALALLSFLTNGIGQVLYVAPSHMHSPPGFTTLQVPLFMGTAFLALAPVLIKQRSAITRPMSGLALALAVLGIINLALVLASVEVLKPLLLSGIVYPATTAGGLVVFSLYSRIILREEYSPLKWAGMAIGICGLALFCIT